MNWFEYAIVMADRVRSRQFIHFPTVATHNHFALQSQGVVCNRHSPVVALSADATEVHHLRLLGPLNSSVGCFWMQQTMHNKGGPGGGSSKDEKWHDFFEFAGTRLNDFPLPEETRSDIVDQIDQLAREKQLCEPHACLCSSLIPQNQVEQSIRASDVRSALQTGEMADQECMGKMRFLQEELDWECYRAYGLLETSLNYDGDVLSLAPATRAFEMILARDVAAGSVNTRWFEWLDISPVTQIPENWPVAYQEIVSNRISTIQSNPEIALLEDPGTKRRWENVPWTTRQDAALRNWLLDRLESYFDFDGRMRNDDSPGNPKNQQATTDSAAPSVTSVHSVVKNDTPELHRSDSETESQKHSSPRRHGVHGEEDQADLGTTVAPSEPPPLAAIQLVSLGKLADVARQDPQFLAVAEVYRDDPAFDVQKLVTELVHAEQVPLLPVLRYKPSGLRKRSQWEQTWQLQRQEDAIDARTTLDPADPRFLTTDQAELEKQSTVGTIPVPPKYTSADFLSTGKVRYWALRGKLDVPKERWISFPHCDAQDGTGMIAWAGYDHLQQATAIAEFYVRVKEEFGGDDDPRLIPLLAALLELLPWIKQWHNQPNADFDGLQMGDYYEGFLQEEARSLGKTTADIANWKPPAAGRRKGKSS